jgi:exopolysaccharide production protein ExoZ
MIGLVSGPFASAVAETYTSYLLVEFAAGVLIGHAWNAGRLRLPFSASLFCIVAGIVLVVGLGGRIGPLFGASLVVMGALHPRFMQWRQDQLLKLGNSSYSLYLTHLFALGALRIAWVRMIPAPPTFMTAAAFMLTALVVCVIVGYLSFVLVERPLLRLFQLPSRSRMGIS